VSLRFVNNECIRVQFCHDQVKTNVAHQDADTCNRHFQAARDSASISGAVLICYIALLLQLLMCCIMFISNIGN